MVVASTRLSLDSDRAVLPLDRQFYLLVKVAWKPDPSQMTLMLVAKHEICLSTN